MGYRGKLAEQARARELRARSWRIADIAAELGVARSSVSLWVRDVAFEPQPRRRSAARRRGPNALARRKQAEIDRLRDEGRERIGALSEREFLVAGVALYAGEGAKTDGAVGLANTNPRFVAFFCSWLRRFFVIDEARLRARLYLHEGLDLPAAVGYWAAVTDIPADQFLKAYRAVPDGGVRPAKHVHGCVTVTYNCARTHRRLMGLAEALFLKPGVDPPDHRLARERSAPTADGRAPGTAILAGAIRGSSIGRAAPC